MKSVGTRRCHGRSKVVKPTNVSNNQHIMKTLKKIPVTYEFVECIPDFDLMEPNVIYISKEHYISCHKCLCGCGNEAAMILNEGDWLDDSGWDYNINNNKITFTPSILNINCPNKYHYIITDGIANVV